MGERLVKTFEEYHAVENATGSSHDITEIENKQLVGTFKEFEKDDKKDRIIKRDSVKLNDTISTDFDKESIEKRGCNLNENEEDDSKCPWYEQPRNWAEIDLKNIEKVIKRKDLDTELKLYNVYLLSKPYNLW